jgi:hypothetical protein
MSNQQQIISSHLINAVNNAIQDLLENHCLYQSVTTDVFVCERAVENIKKIRRSPMSPITGDESAVIRRLIDFKTGAWALTLEGVLPTILAPLKRFETPTPNWFSPPTIRVSCNNCDGVKPPHNPGYLGLTTDSIYAYTSIKDNSIQIFALPYQCQNCKCEPVFFLIRREGVKLTLVGRSQFQEVLVPDFIPKDQRKYYRNAIIAGQTGFTLAAVLYLRTMIEQLFHQKIPQAQLDAIKGNPTGDELGDLYAKTLPDNFPGNFPSLKKAYSDLSEVLHHGKEDVEAINKFSSVKGDVEKHFDALRVFNSISAK